LPDGREKTDGVDRADRREDARETADLNQSEDAQHSEPQCHDGTERFADAFRAALLHDEECEQHDHSQRQDEGFESGYGHFEALHGAQHRNCRRDHAVTVKERGPRQPEHGQDPGQVLAGSSPESQDEERKYSSFALVVGAHDQKNVFDGDDEQEGPNQARQNSENIGLCERQPMLRVEALAKCIDGACSDIAEDDAERSENEAAAAGWDILVILGQLVGRAACRERLLVCFARDDLARMVRHAMLLFSADRMLRRPSQRLVAAS